MSDNQDIVDSIATRTVTEERQNIVSKRVTNRFAIFGMATGFIIAAFGVLAGTGVFDKIGFSVDEKIGYIMLAAGVFMFCYFGMNVRRNEIQVETFTVEKQVPYEMSPVLENKLREREEMIDDKVNAMGAVFEKLALLTSELEERVLAAEKLKLETKTSEETEEQKTERLAKAAASAVVTAMREEKRANEEAENRRRADENARKSEELAKKSELLEKKNSVLAQKEDELRTIKEQLSRIEESQKAARERLRQEEDRFRSESEEREQELKDEKLALATEREELLIAREKLDSEKDSLSLKQKEVDAILKAEAEKRAEEEKREEEARKALEEKKAAEAKIAEDARRAEEERLSDLGLSAVSFAWSSGLRKTEE